MTTRPPNSPTRSLRSLATGFAFACVVAAPALAMAGKLTPPQWASNPIVSPNVVSNGALQTSAPVLGSRSAKANGGYVLHPVCLTADGTVVVGTPEYKYSKWRVVCPDNGKAILNGSKFTTEDKLTVSQRGGLSAATVTFEVPAKTGVRAYRMALCYGKLSGGQTLPGQMSMPASGSMPTTCYVQMMGQSVGLEDWGVFKYTNTGLPSQSGWWSMGANPSPTNSDLSLYAWAPPDNDRLCRAKDSKSDLVYPGRLVQSASKYECRIFTPTGYQITSSFELYIAATSNRPNANTVVKPKATQPWGSGLPIHDGGSDSSRIYGCFLADDDQMGWVNKSEGVCRINGTRFNTSFKLLLD